MEPVGLANTRIALNRLFVHAQKSPQLLRHTYTTVERESRGLIHEEFFDIYLTRDSRISHVDCDEVSFYAQIRD